MGRKAKEAANQKIGNWTGSRRETSKTKTTANSENTNASNENRNPLQTHSQSERNAIKNCKVLLEKLNDMPKPAETVSKTPKKPKTPVEKAPADDVITKDTQVNEKNVYDYSFDGDDVPLDGGDDMKDLIAKMAKENKIEVKKYRPKHVRKKKAAENADDKKAVTKKRQREKQAIDVEPPRKKANLKKPVENVAAPKNAPEPNVAVKPVIRKMYTENELKLVKPKKNIEIIEDVIIREANGCKPAAQTNTATAASNASKQSQLTAANVNIQPRLRNHMNNFQSTPKSSTPLGPTQNAKNKDNQPMFNSLFFASPLGVSTRRNQMNINKQRLQLSDIKDSPDINVGASTSKQAMDENCFAENRRLNRMNINKHRLRLSDITDSPDINVGASTSKQAMNENHFAVMDPIDFDDDFEPQPVPEMDKENSLDRPGSSAQNRSSTNRSNASLFASTSRDQSATSRGSYHTANLNERSVFEIAETSDHIFSPTKRRVYGRSPLKNITSEVNNTNSPSFDSIKSMPRSFGTLPKSTLTSIQENNSAKELTLPEGTYFASRRAAQDFDRTITDVDLVEACFGFDDDDDIENDVANNNSGGPKRIVQNTTKSGGLSEIRAMYKRFLHSSDADGATKKSKAAVPDSGKSKAKTVKNTAKSPAKAVMSPAKAVMSPRKEVRNVFGDAGGKQKDIRSAFVAKSSDKDKHANKAVLFEEVETVQDRRRSYSRPQRVRKRRISIDSESEVEKSDDDDEYDEEGNAKRTKRRKKTASVTPKDVEELDIFARELNEHFNEVNNFEMVVE